MVGGHKIPLCRTFSDVATGQPLAYENANGLLEIAVNSGRADQLLSLRIGDPVTCIP
jgi:hypothetical protein